LIKSKNSEKKITNHLQQDVVKVSGKTNFINPFLYLSLSKLKYFSALKGKQDISEKNLKTFAKLALKILMIPKIHFFILQKQMKF